MDCYTTEGQEDAGIPFFHIIECIPDLFQKFQIFGRTIRKCLQCGKEEEHADDTNSSIYLSNGVSNKQESMQSRINGWCSSLSEFDKKCNCNVFKDDEAVQEMYKQGNVREDGRSVKSTKHQNMFEVVEPPRFCTYEQRVKRMKDCPWMYLIRFGLRTKNTVSNRQCCTLERAALVTGECCPRKAKVLFCMMTHKRQRF